MAISRSTTYQRVKRIVANSRGFDLADVGATKNLKKDLKFTVLQQRELQVVLAQKFADVALAITVDEVGAASTVTDLTDRVWAHIPPGNKA